MNTWIIEPRDPLIVRDGRPFGPNPGARARSLPFPFPSTTAGGVRTRHGQHQNGGIFPAGDQKVIDEVLTLSVRGPLLVELDEQGEIEEWLLPAPADAVLLRVENDGQEENDVKQVNRRRLVPLLLDGDLSNLPSGLLPVGMTPPDPAKTEKKAPVFWNWQAYKTWLLAPVDGKVTLATLGHSGPLREERMHVFINAETQTAREGFLFLTSGLEFSRPERSDSPQLPPQSRLGLALKTDAKMAEGVAPLGGERRLMAWRRSDEDGPKAPQELVEQIMKDSACRLILLTPAFFKQGWRPHWLLQKQHGVQPVLKAVAARQPQVVSGWDFAAGAPKPSRRLAPAGSTYFLSLEGERQDIRQWVNKMWMATISDDPEQNRLDGFGLSMLGTWSGQPQSLEVPDEEA